MRSIEWQKHGLVLTPDGAPDWRQHHSGMVSAQPLAGGGYRLYVTGRDAAGRFQIGWVELDAEFRVTRECPDDAVLSVGRMGCFDCNGVCMPWVVSAGNGVLFMYYVGWGPSPPGVFVNRCGLAASSDGGETWTRHSEAPLALIDGVDPIGIGTVCVLPPENGLWRMWYTTFREWQALDDGAWRHYYYIRYAESDDGIDWRKPEDNLAIDFVGEEYAVARPMVLREPAGWRMWFCTRSVGSTYRIGYAESEDGRRWTRAPSGIEPSASGWDSEMIEYSFVLREPDRYVMFYNGNGFGATGTGLALGRE